jgi:hypothetical protein
MRGGREGVAVGCCSSIVGGGGVGSRRGRKMRIFSKGLDTRGGHIAPPWGASRRDCTREGTRLA